MRKRSIINRLLGFILGIFWVFVLFFHGLAGTFAWFGLKIVFPVIGLIILLISLIRLVIKKDRFRNSLVTIVLSLLMIAPITLVIGIFHTAYPIRESQASPALTVSWPLKEQTIVGWGGNTYEENYHSEWPATRWAYDLVMEPYNTNNPKLASYGCWNKEVVSPVEGTVVGAYDKDADHGVNLDEFDSQGNYVFIKVKETGTYLALYHLKQDSVTVAKGDQVKVGDTLGRVGNSGASSEPHLHIHHQKQNPVNGNQLLAEGLPLYFKLQGKQELPVKGTIVTP